MEKKVRADHTGAHRRAFDKNKARIYKTQCICGICGKPVDFSLKYPHPLSATIDHIIPIDRGGHPSDIDNLQLAHFTCNRTKSDKLYRETKADSNTMKHDAMKVVSNRNLPQSCDWSRFSGK